jgi:hypothetical protein
MSNLKKIIMSLALLVLFNFAICDSDSVFADEAWEYWDVTLGGSVSRNYAIDGWYGRENVQVDNSGITNPGAVNCTVDWSVVTMKGTKIGYTRVKIPYDSRGQNYNNKNIGVRVHPVVTDIKISNPTCSAPQTLYLYEGEKYTLTANPLPFDTNIEEDWKEQSKNAWQQCSAFSNDNKIATAKCTYGGKGSSIEIVGVKSGDTTVKITADGSTQAGLKPVSKEISVHVRKKPSFSMNTDVVKLATNVKKESALSFSSVNLDDFNELSVWWEGNDKNIAEVQKNSNHSVTITTGSNSGETNIKCTIADDVVRGNWKTSYDTYIFNIKVIVKNYELKVLDSNQKTINDKEILLTKEDLANGYNFCATEDEAGLKYSASVDNGGIIKNLGEGKFQFKGTTTGKYTCLVQSETGNAEKVTFVVNMDTVNVGSVENSGNGLKIKWDTVKGSDYYEVYRSEDKDANYTKIGTVKEGNAFIDSNVEIGKKYYYKVASVTDGIISSYSDVFEKYYVPATPTVVGITKQFSQYRMAIEGEIYDGFEIYSNGNLLTLATSNNVTVSLKAGSYKFKVRAFKKVNNKRVYGEFSEEYFYVVQKEQNAENKSQSNKSLLPATKIKKVVKKGKKYVVTIKKVKGTKKYQIKYSANKKMKKSKMKIFKKNRGIIKITGGKKAYYFSVRYLKGKIWSKWSKLKKCK